MKKGGQEKEETEKEQEKEAEKEPAQKASSKGVQLVRIQIMLDYKSSNVEDY